MRIVGSVEGSPPDTPAKAFVSDHTCSSRAASQARSAGLSYPQIFLPQSRVAADNGVAPLLGREQLLKDRVQDGEGVLIVEEAPMTGRRGRGVRRGLEGALRPAPLTRNGRNVRLGWKPTSAHFHP